uniref:Uncharacterized protein n=1 Tax=Monopterus albus TaxID=43700 RepID=A0A3Q3IUZ6_MONAL
VKPFSKHLRRSFFNVWRGPGRDDHGDCTVPTVKRGGGSVLIWGCMLVNKKMTPGLKKLDRRGNFQHDLSQTHCRRTQEFLKGNKVNTVTWRCMSPDLNLIENSSMFGLSCSHAPNSV